ncbi:MAG TPA: hypothetical protein VI320_00120 [Terracidiphilus sp.]
MTQKCNGPGNLEVESSFQTTKQTARKARQPDALLRNRDGNKMKQAGFLICSGIGYLIGHYMGNGALAAYLSILVSYHLYLGFLVIMAEKETGFSVPIVQTVVTHAACLAVVVGIAMGRHTIPFFAVIRLLVPAIAPFEVTWLFSGGRKKAVTTEDLLTRILPAVGLVSTGPAAARPAAEAENGGTPAAHGSEPAAATPITFGSATSSLFGTSTGEQYEEFLKLLHEGKRPFRKPGQAIRDEYEVWLAHRAKHPVEPSSCRQQV